MNSEEAMMLCRYAKACCPSQKFDEFTPDAWFDLLGDIDAREAKAAITAIAKRSPWVGPSEIRTQVARMQGERIKAIASLQPPAYIEAIEDEAEFDKAYRAWMRDAHRAIDAGEQPPTREPLAIESGDASAIKVRMEADALELVRKQSLREAEARERAEAKRARYAAIRADELATHKGEDAEVAG